MFRSRDSVGVRGIRLAADDEVVAMSVLNHVAYGRGRRRRTERTGRLKNRRPICAAPSTRPARTMPQDRTARVILSKGAVRELGALPKIHPDGDRERHGQARGHRCLP